MNGTRRGVFWALGFWCFTLVWALPATSQDAMQLPCEVMESSEALNSSVARLNGLRYLLIHHANSADRDTLSQWLTEHSGAEVVFTFQNKSYKGILCRLANCFGRGLLIYADDIQPVKRDIITVFIRRYPKSS